MNINQSILDLLARERDYGPPFFDFSLSDQFFILWSRLGTTTFLVLIGLFSVWVCVLFVFCHRNVRITATTFGMCATFLVLLNIFGYVARLPAYLYNYIFIIFNKFLKNNKILFFAQNLYNNFITILFTFIKSCILSFFGKKWRCY